MIKQVCQIYIFITLYFFNPSSLCSCDNSQKKKEAAQKETRQLFHFWLGNTFPNPNVVKENPPKKWKKQNKAKKILPSRWNLNHTSSVRLPAWLRLGFIFFGQHFSLFSAINTRDLNPAFLNIPKSFFELCAHVYTLLKVRPFKVEHMTSHSAYWAVDRHRVCSGRQSIFKPRTNLAATAHPATRYTVFPH